MTNLTPPLALTEPAAYTDSQSTFDLARPDLSVVAPVPGATLVAGLMCFWGHGEHGHRAATASGPLCHTASAHQSFKHCPTGTPVYVVSWRNGRAILVGRLYAEHVVGLPAAKKLLGTTDLWHAEHHIIDLSGAGPRERWDRYLPRDVLLRLESIRGTRPKPNPATGEFHWMSLATPRYLTHRSVALLDREFTRQP